MLQKESQQFEEDKAYSLLLLDLQHRKNKTMLVSPGWYLHCEQMAQKGIPCQGLSGRTVITTDIAQRRKETEGAQHSPWGGES